MADRPRRGRPSLWCRASLVSAHIRGSPSPARELAVEPQAKMIRILREEQLLAQEDQQQSQDDMTRVLERVRGDGRCSGEDGEEASRGRDSRCDF